jgi:hypothetical protein
MTRAVLESISLTGLWHPHVLLYPPFLARSVKNSLIHLCAVPYCFVVNEDDEHAVFLME